MKHLLTILAALFLCSAPLHAQTMKALMFNSTNGQVVANTGTNALKFIGPVVVANQTGDEIVIDSSGISGWGGAMVSLEEKLFQAGSSGNVGWTFDAPVSFGNAAAETRTNLGLGATWLTNTNVTNFRTAIGLGETNNVIFNQVEMGDTIVDNTGIKWGGGYKIELEQDHLIGNWTVFGALSFNNITNAATTRTNLGLPLAALTNTSNVTAMRALGGSTNTNEPYSGTVALTNTNVLTFSNGVLLKIQ